MEEEVLVDVGVWSAPRTWRMRPWRRKGHGDRSWSRQRSRKREWSQSTQGSRNAGNGADPNVGGNDGQPAPLTWNDEDLGAPGQREFAPLREPGGHFPENFQPVRELCFFKLFLSDEVAEAIARHTNEDAWQYIGQKQGYANRTGGLTNKNPDEIYRLLALVIYMSICKLPRLSDFWSTAPLFHGNWACRLIPSHRRFKAHMTFLHIQYYGWQASQSPFSLWPCQGALRKPVPTMAEVLCWWTHDTAERTDTTKTTLTKKSHQKGSRCLLCSMLRLCTTRISWSTPGMSQVKMKRQWHEPSCLIPVLAMNTKVTVSTLTVFTHLQLWCKISKRMAVIW